MLRLASCLTLSVLMLTASLARGQEVPKASPTDPAKIEFFEKKIRPGPGREVLLVPQPPRPRSSRASTTSTPARPCSRAAKSRQAAIVPGEARQEPAASR